MTIIDGVTDSVIATISVGEEPQAFVHIPQENRVYVANYSNSTISVIRDEFPGIEEHSTLDAINSMPEIYPNPAKSFFAIHSTASAKAPIELKIFDLTGRVVKALRISAPEVKINIKGVNPGVYFLQLKNVTKPKKLIVTR